MLPKSCKETSINFFVFRFDELERRDPKCKFPGVESKTVKVMSLRLS